jgi:hypothetical protein
MRTREFEKMLRYFDQDQVKLLTACVSVINELLVEKRITTRQEFQDRLLGWVSGRRNEFYQDRYRSHLAWLKKKAKLKKAKPRKRRSQKRR